ncbi:unnamed protein product, partial [Meganyctiphanes norvegica]
MSLKINQILRGVLLGGWLVVLAEAWPQSSQRHIRLRHHGNKEKSQKGQLDMANQKMSPITDTTKCFGELFAGDQSRFCNSAEAEQAVLAVPVIKLCKEDRNYLKKI